MIEGAINSKVNTQMNLNINMNLNLVDSIVSTSRLSVDKLNDLHSLGSAKALSKGPSSRLKKSDTYLDSRDFE